eukprot:3881997-Prymnesium_polylepis.1
MSDGAQGSFQPCQMNSRLLSSILTTTALRVRHRDYIDGGSAARGVVALLDAPARPKRFVYELALGRCVPHGELLAAVCGVRPEQMKDPAVLQEFTRRFAPVELVPPGGNASLVGAH